MTSADEGDDVHDDWSMLANEDAMRDEYNMILLFVRRVKWKELRLTWWSMVRPAGNKLISIPKGTPQWQKPRQREHVTKPKFIPIRITDSIVSEIFLLTYSYLLTKTIYISKKLPLLSKRQKINPEFFQTSPAQSYLSWYAPKK